jgi:hypothetical protein
MLHLSGVHLPLNAFCAQISCTESRASFLELVRGTSLHNLINSHTSMHIRRSFAAELFVGALTGPRTCVPMAARSPDPPRPAAIPAHCWVSHLCRHPRRVASRRGFKAQMTT